MTSFAMTERAPFYFKLRNARADRSPAKEAQGQRLLVVSGEKHKLVPLSLTGDALERCRA